MNTPTDHQSGWVTYDDFVGPELDSGLWTPADFGTGPLLEPDARTTVQDGTATIDIPRFQNRSDEIQGLDNTKHLLFSTRSFPLPEGRTARFSAQLRSEIHGAAGDYRLALASFIVVDRGPTHRVFAIFSSGERIFAEEEVLPGNEQLAPFTRVIEDPFLFSRRDARPDDGFRRATIELDRSRGQVVYRVDDEILHVAGGLGEMPQEINLALGFFSLLPLGTGEGSANGQGARASWRELRYSEND